MARLFLLLTLCFLAGCSRDDARLQGIWHSDRDATVAAMFDRDPRWTNATPEKIERVKEVFGHMTLIYSNGLLTTTYRGETGSFPYWVVRRGADFVVVRTGGESLDSGRDIVIRFVDNGNGYWSDSGPDPLVGASTLEKFNRVAASQSKE